MLRQCFNDGWMTRRHLTPLDAVLTRKDEVQALKAVTLPHDAMILGKRSPDDPSGGGGAFFKGENVEYTKTFFVPAEDKGKVFFLEFEGVFQNAYIWVNGGFAGNHPYGYSNFYVKISDFLRYGEENTLLVVAKNGAQPGARWYSGTGIYRDVKLLVGDPLHIKIDGVMISTPTAKRTHAMVHVVTQVENEGLGFKSGWVKTELRDPEGKLAGCERTKFHITSGGEVTLRQNIYIKNPSLWDVDTPQLYTCITTLESEDGQDTAVNTFGIRSLELDPEHGLQLNGRRLMLKGGCIHHDNGLLGAATFADAELRRARLHKQAGYNALRSAHYPMSKAMLDACDRVGLVVMDEFTDVWTSCKSDFDYGLHFAQWWEQDVELMVRKDFNHPCVVLYSIGNEIQEVGSATDASWGRKIAEKIRSLDTTRYITNGFNLLGAILDVVQKLLQQTKPESAGAASGEINQVMMDIQSNNRENLLRSKLLQDRIDESSGIVDVVGFNYAPERYLYEKALSPNRIVIGTETSPEALARNWKLVEENPHVLGDFGWTSWDYLGEVGIGHIGYEGERITSFYGSYPWITAWCGDFDITGCRRPISYWREIVWGGADHIPYLAVQKPERYGQTPYTKGNAWTDSLSSWTWPGFEGKPIVVEAYSDAQEAELFINGKSKGRIPVRDSFNPFYCKWDTVYEPGTVEVVAYTEGREIGRYCLKTAGAPVLRLTPECDSLRAGTNDLCYVHIELVDKDGIVNPAAEKEVTVHLEGAGILQASGSADPKTEEYYYNSTHKTFQGRMLAILRAGKEAGVARLTAAAEELAPVTLEITVKEEA